MARDTAKCSGDGCAMRDDCYRFTSPVGQWQVWFQRPPHDGKACLWIIPNGGTDGQQLVDGAAA